MNRVRKARRRRPLMSPVLFAPLILLIGLVAMPNPEDATERLTTVFDHS